MLSSSAIAVGMSWLVGGLSAPASTQQSESQPVSREAPREGTPAGPLGPKQAILLQTLARILPPGPRKISNATVALNLPQGAWFGHSVAALGDLDGDGVQDLAVGAPGDGLGSVRILFLNPDRSVRAHTRIGAPSSTYSGSYGHAVCALGDLNGDGATDIAASNPVDCEVFVHFLRTDGTVLASVRISDSLEPPVFGGALDSYGEGLASLGDVDADGVTDLVVACGVGFDGEDPRFYVMRLRMDGTVKGYARTSIGSTGLTCGALGDLDGDGIREFAMGNSNDRNIRTYFLRANGTVRTLSSLATAQYATPVVGVPDLFGSGLPGWALGLTGTAGGRGGYSLAALDAGGGVIPGSGILVPGPEGRSELLLPGDAFGSSLAYLGNLDGFGKVEIAVGAIGTDDGALSSGAVWIGAIR